MQEEIASERFYQLTGIEPQPFLRGDAKSDIAEGRCVLCHSVLSPDESKYFCLIGRHRVLSQGDKWSWAELSIMETAKYAFQSAYVRICNRCHAKYSRRLSVALRLLGITVIPAVVLFFILLILLGEVYYRILGFVMLFAVFILVGLFTMAKSFCDSKHFSWKTVEINEVLPRYGVPDYNDSPYKENELVSEEELLDVLAALNVEAASDCALDKEFNEDKR